MDDELEPERSLRSKPFSNPRRMIMPVKDYVDTTPNPMEQGYVFVLLPEKTKDIYENYVKKAADSLTLRCESFLDLKAPEDALDAILARIQRAEILIYDITDFTPNVMWE